jgi:hypothetical protein
MRDNTYKIADELRSGDSLMPLYRELEEHGYERCLNPRTGKYTMTHRLIFRANNKLKKGYVIHHFNCKKGDNSPDNFRYMTILDHDNWHLENMTGLIGYAKSDKGRQKSGEIMKSVMSDPIRKAEILKKKEEGFVNWVAEGNKTGFALWDKETLIEHTKNIIDHKKGGETYHQRYLSDNEFAETVRNRSIGNLKKIHGRKNLVNHKVVSVKVAGFEDVYDFEVEKYHNFALSAGVFVHNCVIAGRGHHTLRLEANQQCTLIPITTQDVETEYFKETGGPDSGLNILNSLNEWRTSGWTAAGKLYKIFAYAQIDLTNHAEVEDALFLFNGIYAGVNLPISAQSQTGEGKVWDVDNSPNGEPGSWGGHCFTGDTKISLLNGTEITLKELAENYVDKEFWVYSLDENKNVVPGKGKLPRLTRKNAKLLKITLDNGESIRCTEDHQFLMRDGQYKEAKYLKQEDSLMPLYRESGRGGYEQCLNPSNNNYVFTHELVATDILVISVEDAGYEDVYDFEVEKYHNFALSAGVFVHNCTYIVALNLVGPVCVTWGARQQMTWAFWDKYYDEAYAVIDNIDSWVDPATDPVNVQLLSQYLSEVTASPVNPTPDPSVSGTVIFNINPKTATAYIDGGAIPGQPVNVLLDAGTYEISAKLKGYKTASTKIAVAAGSMQTVTLTLQKKRCWLANLF